MDSGGFAWMNSWAVLADDEVRCDGSPAFSWRLLSATRARGMTVPERFAHCRSPMPAVKSRAQREI